MEIEFLKKNPFRKWKLTNGKIRKLVFVEGHGVCRAISAKHAIPLEKELWEGAILLNPPSQKHLFERRAKRVINSLKDKGFNKNFLKEMEIYLKVGFDRCEKIFDAIYKFDKSDVPLRECLAKEFPGFFFSSEIFLRLIQDKSPFEKMKFSISKSYNDFYKEKVKEALNTLTPYKTGRNSLNSRLDSSFSLEKHGDKFNAFYAKEFEGTGNGYYYIVISDTEAFFLEKD